MNHPADLNGHSALKAMGRLHHTFVHTRRVDVLARAISPWLSGIASVIDVGCGDGLLTESLLSAHPDLNVRGYDVLLRPRSVNFPIEVFDAFQLPLADASVDSVLLIDVLHHSEFPMRLLTECRRVARYNLIIKDHRLSRPGAKMILGAMDWVSNRPHSVALRMNYWTEQQWTRAWEQLGLKVKQYRTDLGIYPRWAQPLFEYGLHFLTCLSIEGPHGEK